MAARGASLRRFTLVLLLSLSATAARPARVLLCYSLDDDGIVAADDANGIYEAARGSVELSGAMPYSGYRSVEIRDRAADGQFPELLGFFPLHRDGVLSAHFALLKTDARQTLGVALAGPEWLALRRDGIGFRLQARGGSLYHFPRGAPQRLLPLRPFSWYLVDIVYQVGPGTYDLVIHEEGRGAPLVTLREQVNAVQQPGSGINALSFTGDPTDDASNVVYYVDDVILASGPSAGLPAGWFRSRRKLYDDTWNDDRLRRAPIPGCLSPVDRRDLGVAQAQSDELRRHHSASPLEVATSAPAPGIDRAPALPADLARLLEAAIAWGRGCSALEEESPRAALEQFDRAAHLHPSGRIYALSATLALARLGRWGEVDARLLELRPAWTGDPRLPIVIGMITASRPDLGRALEWAQDPGPRLPADRSASPLRRLWSGAPDASLPAELRHAYGAAAADYLRDALIVEQYFLAGLWAGSFHDAQSFAARVAGRLHEAGLPDGGWIERQGDAAFLLGDRRAARRHYLQALEQQPDSRTLPGKLADLCFRDGDLEGERRYRRISYGATRSMAP